MSSGMGLAALPVDILPHDIKVRDIARHHPVEGGLAGEALRLVRLADPFVRSGGHENLQAFVDALHIGNPLERILRQRHDLAAFSLMKRRPAFEPPDRTLHAFPSLPRPETRK